MQTNWLESLHEDISRQAEKRLARPAAARLAQDIITHIRDEYGTQRLYVTTRQPLDRSRVARYVEQGRQQGKSVAALAAELGIHRSTAYRCLSGK